MKLQIKTIEQKSLMVDIEETKTVYDLKKKLSLYADVGVEPELQKIIYNGIILNNNDPLSIYNIDVKKYLIIMILRQPSSMNVAEEQQNIQDIPVSSNTSSADESKIKSAANGISSAEQESDVDDMVKKLTSMGFSEVEILQALKACSNNPNEAIDYLIANTPLPRYRLVIKQVIDVHAAQDEALINTRQAVIQNPELLNSPPTLNIVDNREDYLAMLLENMSNGNADDDDEVEN